VTPAAPDIPFTSRIREVLNQTALRCPGYYPTELLFLLGRCRGDFTRTLRRLVHGPMASTGLDRLAERGAYELSLESVILEDRWAALFDPSDRSAARRRLDLAQEGAFIGRARRPRPLAAADVVKTVRRRRRPRVADERGDL
jgi:hypothetical protein